MNNPPFTINWIKLIELNSNISKINHENIAVTMILARIAPKYLIRYLTLGIKTKLFFNRKYIEYKVPPKIADKYEIVAPSPPNFGISNIFNENDIVLIIAA